MKPARWLTYAAQIALFTYVLAGVAALALLQRARMSARVPKAFVTGHALAAMNEAGVFATPVLPRGAHPAIPHADAESAAVAMGYWAAPSVQDLTALPAYKEIPLERRHRCGRTYYVRPIVAMPDTTLFQQASSNFWGMWSPSWVIPICDDAERVRTTVIFFDLPTGGLRVIQGAQLGDVPVLVSPPGTHAHITSSASEFFPDWERGIGITPETAVDLSAAQLRGTGARVTEVPEASTVVVPFNAWKRAPSDSQPFAETAQCVRWRLTLDRPVTLRGIETGQVTRTPTVYVTRGDDGCHGAPVLEIPKLAQPQTVPFTYMVRRSRDSLVRRVREGIPRFPPVDFFWTKVRVLEPIWFERARLIR